MKKINYTLPEFVFLDGNSPEGDTLKDRTVIQHIRSYTILEAFMPNELKRLHLNCPTFEFTYKNKFDIDELHVLAIHFSFADESQWQEILKKTADWYRNYLAWEDNNIQQDEIAKHN